MKLWLDDEYETRKSWFPSDWVHCRWPEEVINYLKTGKVQEVSLDHDLGEDVGYANPRTGYDVVLWLEQEIANNNWPFELPRFRIHSQNPVGRNRIKACLRNIEAMREKLTS